MTLSLIDAADKGWTFDLKTRCLHQAEARSKH
jgi:hypothetical protein